MGKSLSIVSALIIFSFVGLLIYKGYVILPDFWTQLAVGLIFLAVGVLSWSFKSEIINLVKGEKLKFDPRFNHVEAWLFYGPEISYEKGERHPTKNNPRKKLVCNTHAKKAYYVDRVVWEMIYDEKIRWHSEDDQDLKEWCTKMGYKLFKRDAREVDLLAPSN